MANDQTEQKRILQEAEDRRRRQDVRTRIQNAQRINKLLALDELTPQEKEALKYSRTYEDFSRILGQRHIVEQRELWEALEDWRVYKDVPVPPEPLPSQTGTNQPGSPGSSGITGLAAGAAGVFLLAPESYKDATESAERHANLSLSQWEREEEELKKSGKTPPPGRPKTREEAYERAHNESYDGLVRKNHYRAKRWALRNPDDMALAQALDRRELQRKDLTYQELKDLRNKYLISETEKWKTVDPGKRGILSDHLDLADREFHDRLLLHSPEQAREWAKNYNDPELHTAIERKRQADEERRNNSNIRKKYYESGLEEKVSKAKTKLKKSKARRALARVSDGYKKITDIPSRTRDYLAQTRIGKTISKIRNKINYAFGAPGRQYGKFKKWLSQTRIGKTYTKIFGAPGRLKNRIKNRILNSHLGRFGSKLNRIGKRIKNLLNPVSFLTRFFARTLISSAIGAVAGFFAGVLSFVVGAFISFIAGVTGLATTAIALVVSAVGWPVTLALAILLFVIMLFTFFQVPCLIFCNIDGTIDDSPYPGIAYSIIGPNQIPNGDNIKYQIVVVHNSNQALPPLSALTLVADVPFGTALVTSETTGSFIEYPSSDKVKWKLSENEPASESDETTMYQFSLTLNPEDDITVETSISLEGAGDRGDQWVIGGDCKDRVPIPYNSNNSEKGNFGDPACSFSKAAADEEMRLYDPENADFWYLIAECESSHWPNAFNPSAKEATGAWGMYQMSYKKNPGPPYYNAGQVPWNTQTQEAFNRETKVAETRTPITNNPFDYWQCETNACQDAPGMCTNGEYNVRGRTW